MRDNDDQRSARYAPRGDRARSSFGGGNRGGGSSDGNWKGRRDAEPDQRPGTPGARDQRGGGRGAGSGASSGNRPQLEDMDVFRLAHDLAVRTHELTSRFPAEERGSLVALLRRASAAVPAQLASGSSRWDRVQFRDAVTSARDAAAETRYFLLLTKDLGHLTAQDCDDMRDGYERVAKMLTRLAQALQEGSR